MRRFRKNICLDFDGVTHSYTSEWQGAGVATDPPVEGMAEWIKTISKFYDITIYSARLNNPEGVGCIKQYFEQHGLPPSLIETFKWHAKPHAHIYIDDRAFHFKGVFPTLKEINEFKPWNK